MGKIPFTSQVLVYKIFRQILKQEFATILRISLYKFDLIQHKDF